MPFGEVGVGTSPTYLGILPGHKGRGVRQFEFDDLVKAMAGDSAAELRVHRRKEVLQFNAENRSNVMFLATPNWADKKAIKAIYEEARRRTLASGIPHEVDHVLPIQGRKVCGLHVEYNLQILTASENISKHARYDEEKPSGAKAGK